MTMTVVVVTGLVFGNSLKAVSDDQAQFHEQFERVIQRCPADRKLQVAVQLFTKFLQREMTIDAIDGIKDGKALRRLAELVQFQVIGEDIPDRYLNTIFHFMWSDS